MLKNGYGIIKNLMIMIMTACIICCLFFYGTWNYKFVESTENVSNPYQGDYIQVDTKNAEELYRLKREEEFNVVFLACDLKEEKDNLSLSESKIEEVQKAFEVAKSLKLSVVFRAAYDFNGKYEDPKFEVMLNHMEELGVVLNKYKECIAGVQVGMIGAFGEWNQSQYMEDKECYLKIIEKWLEILDKEIPISVRRQKFIRDAQKRNIDTSRIGIYNDGLFSSESDLGTYQGEYDRQDELEWSENNIRVSFNGGEMPWVTEYSDIENVVYEANKLQLSYLNKYYNVAVWEYWESQEIEGMSGKLYLQKHLGIRPWIANCSINKNYKMSPFLHIKAEIRNSGFAALEEEIQAYIVVEANGMQKRHKAKWQKISKEIGEISIKANNPFWMKEHETIKIGLQLCRGDWSEEKQGYCIKLANEGIRYQDDINWLIGY